MPCRKMGNGKWFLSDYKPESHDENGVFILPCDNDIVIRLPWYRLPVVHTVTWRPVTLRIAIIFIILTSCHLVPHLCLLVLSSCHSLTNRTFTLSPCRSAILSHFLPCNPIISCLLLLLSCHPLPCRTTVWSHHPLPYPAAVSSCLTCSLSYHPVTPFTLSYYPVIRCPLILSDILSPILTCRSAILSPLTLS